MPSIQKILLTATFAAFVAAQQQTDGQVTAPTSVAGQQTDGQVTVATSAAGQQTDGQVTVATSVAGQQTDGQVTVATSVAPASQISDGQIQIPTAVSTGAPVPSPNGTTIAPATPSPSAFQGAANAMGWTKEIAFVAIGAVAGLVML